MCGNECAHPNGIRIAEIAQAPTDSYIDEEFLLVQIIFDDFFNNTVSVLDLKPS